MKSNTARWLLLLACSFLILSACRLGDALEQTTSKPTAIAQTKRTPTPRETHTPTVASDTMMDLPTETEVPTDTEAPTETEAPTDTEAPTETDVPFIVPTDMPEPTDTLEPTETAVPTPEFPFIVSSSDCRPNVRTYIEGTVYENGVEKNGVLARISLSPGGDPAPNDDYVTGTDRSRPGYYFQNIDVKGPRGGVWYIFLLDPQTRNRISTIATVKTDSKRVEDNGESAGSCQSAVVNFSSVGDVIDPTETPEATDTPATTTTATPSRTGTAVTPTRTGTPSRTPTPTRTPTRTPAH
ncbi:MAG: hypothetical protein WCF84_12535 [Anaerolineae bacterium]